MALRAATRVAHAARGVRQFSSAASCGLKERLIEIIPQKKAEVKEFRDKYAEASLGTITLDKVYGGMRDMTLLVTETSLLDPRDGIHYRGLSLFDCQEKLPKAKDGDQMLPEGVFWLLLTGEVPTKAQVDALSREWARRATVPRHVADMLSAFPRTLHPMSQLSAAVCALQSESKFAKAYAAGTAKDKLWEACYEDAMDIIAKLPTVAAAIYRNTYKDGHVAAIDPTKDWSANFAAQLGFNTKEVSELLRLYLSIHADHEGGNVSAHTTHLVGSALSDPYLSYAAGMNGLAGPLHGLANQEVLIFIRRMVAEIGETPSDEALLEFAKKLIANKQVIPGYGHAVLRVADPRFVCQQRFAEKYIKGDKLVSLVHQIYRVIPGLLSTYGKIKNPWPNVDAHSGVLLNHYGITEMNYYTVLFGVSRALGVLASLTWDRIFGLPLERPKSETTASLKALLTKAQ